PADRFIIIVILRDTCCPPAGTLPPVVIPIVEEYAMTDTEGSISTEVRGHILLIGFNRPAKYNSYTPTMARQLVDAFTRLDEDPELWVGVVFGHGKHFCAGLDLPKWTASMNEGGGLHDYGVDPLALGR